MAHHKRPKAQSTIPVANALGRAPPSPHDGGAAETSYSAASFCALGFRCWTLGITSRDSNSSEWRHACGLSR